MGASPTARSCRCRTAPATWCCRWTPSCGGWPRWYLRPAATLSASMASLPRARRCGPGGTQVRGASANFSGGPCWRCGGAEEAARCAVGLGDTAEAQFRLPRLHLSWLRRAPEGTGGAQRPRSQGGVEAPGVAHRPLAPGPCTRPAPRGVAARKGTGPRHLGFSGTGWAPEAARQASRARAGRRRGPRPPSRATARQRPRGRIEGLPDAEVKGAAHSA